MRQFLLLDIEKAAKNMENPVFDQLEEARLVDEEPAGLMQDYTKSSFLTRQAQSFIQEHALALLAGLSMQGEIYGQVVVGKPGFIKTPDTQTCMIPLMEENILSPLRNFLLRASNHRQPAPHMVLTLTCHSTRRRLCIHGSAEWEPIETPNWFTQYSPQYKSSRGGWIRLHVSQAFFHYPPYMRSIVPGLTRYAFNEGWNVADLVAQNRLNYKLREFLRIQFQGFLCTLDRKGRCAINYRSGRAGFMIPLPASIDAPQGRIMIPDYPNSNAQEMLNHIQQTGRAALLLPDYSGQFAICLSGHAQVLNLNEITPEVRQACPGAERVVAFALIHSCAHNGNWQLPLAYEQVKAAKFRAERRLILQSLSPEIVEMLLN